MNILYRMSWVYGGNYTKLKMLHESVFVLQLLLSCNYLNAYEHEDVRMQLCNFIFNLNRPT